MPHISHREATRRTILPMRSLKLGCTSLDLHPHLGRCSVHILRQVGPTVRGEPWRDCRRLNRLGGDGVGFLEPTGQGSVHPSGLFTSVGDRCGFVRSIVIGCKSFGGLHLSHLS